MKTRLLVTLVGLATSFALPTFAQEQNTIDPEVRQQIEEVLMKFGEAFNKHDAAAMAALYTQDAIQFWSWWSADALVSGQQPIEKRYASMFASSPGEFVGQLVEVYAIGNEMSVIVKGSEGALWKGYKAWICVRDADTWKIRMEYVN
jgi:ketosteroid isomerase-like protein